MSTYETLAGMRYQDRLKIACSCGHRSEFSQAEAIALFGPDATPFNIRRRMRCSRCHQVGKVEVSV